jgi:hypothetical protein
VGTGFLAIHNTPVFPVLLFANLSMSSVFPTYNNAPPRQEQRESDEQKRRELQEYMVQHNRATGAHPNADHGGAQGQGGSGQPHKGQGNQGKFAPEMDSGGGGRGGAGKGGVPAMKLPVGGGARDREGKYGDYVVDVRCVTWSTVQCMVHFRGVALL